MQKIKVVKIESKPTKNNSMMVAVYDEKGIRFSGFLKELQDVREGDIIDADIQVDGKYNNITAVKILEHGVTPVSVEPAQYPHSSVKNGIERRSIERQVAVKVAAQINIAPVNVKKLLEDAEEIARWIAEETEERQKTQEAKSAAPKVEPDKRDAQPIKPPGLNRIAGIDMDWLKQELGNLQKASHQEWSNAAVIEKLNKITGKAAKSVSEAVRPLNAKQAQEFVEEVQEALNKGG